MNEEQKQDLLKMFNEIINSDYVSYRVLEKILSEMLITTRQTQMMCEELELGDSNE